MPRIHTTNPNYRSDLDNLKFWDYPRRGSADDRPYIESLIRQIPEKLWFRATEEYNNEYLKNGGKSANEKLERFVKSVLAKLKKHKESKRLFVAAQLDAAGRTPKTGARVRIRSKK